MGAPTSRTGTKTSSSGSMLPPSTPRSSKTSSSTSVQPDGARKRVATVGRDVGLPVLEPRPRAVDSITSKTLGTAGRKMATSPEKVMSMPSPRRDISAQARLFKPSGMEEVTAPALKAVSRPRVALPPSSSTFSTSNPRVTHSASIGPAKSSATSSSTTRLTAPSAQMTSKSSSSGLPKPSRLPQPASASASSTGLPAPPTRLLAPKTRIGGSVPASRAGSASSTGTSLSGEDKRARIQALLKRTQALQGK